ncbi:MAG: putative ribonuclease inhibitor RraA/dimethylmenaquinone methyltransferase [Brevibacillus sp.]|nr:putative ribonuclease inhibitor RraA/dimethylmenaquinone methyltransferase [Brevibacillus sp.]
MAEQTWIERLSKLDSCAVSDAMEKVGLKGAVLGIRPMWSCERIVGRAVTIKIKPVGLVRPTQHLCTPAIEAAERGDILVIDNAGRVDVATWGGILTFAAKVKGISGVVIDGACRDLDESRELEFPVFARTAVPVTARGRIMQESFNEEIQCGGVSVSAGDLVIADSSGVVLVPAEKAEEVITAAEAIAAREKRMAEEIGKGRSVVEVMESMQYEAMNVAEGEAEIG